MAGDAPTVPTFGLLGVLAVIGAAVVPPAPVTTVFRLRGKPARGRVRLT